MGEKYTFVEEGDFRSSAQESAGIQVDTVPWLFKRVTEELNGLSFCEVDEPCVCRAYQNDLSLLSQ